MPDRELSTTAYLTLGLLTSRDWSAYQLAEQVGRGVAQLWPSAERQRYNVLKRLLELDLVETREEPTGKRTRTVYSITEAGRAELARWLATDARPPAFESEALVHLLVADQGTIDDLRRTIEQLRDQALGFQRMFAQYSQYISDTGGTFPERQHLFGLANTFMIGHYEHVVTWAAWALEQIEDWPDASSPAETHRDQVRAMMAPGREAWQRLAGGADATVEPVED